MGLKSIVEKGWNFTQDYFSRAVSSPINTVKTITLTAIATMIIGCPGKTPTEPDNPPFFVSGTPTSGTTTTKIGNSHTVRGTAEDPDGDNINYKTLKDGTQVNNTNEYTFTIDKKGMTKIQIVAYNTLSDTLTKNFLANNQTPIATSKSITSYEETTTAIPESELGYDPDGDELDYSVTSTSGVVDAKFENGNLVIEREKDYFGSAEINYSLTDGEATSNGTVNDEIANVPDNTKANAGTDQTKTINEEITLNGEGSSHPDNPLSSITEYLWRQISGPNTNIENSNEANANFTANTRGNYQIELTVTDEQGATGKDTVNVSVNSYKITINTTNVLNDENISGLEVMLAGKTATTNSAGQVELEYPTNASLSGNLSIKDENIEGSIGDFFNYSENIDITGDAELNIEMIPNVEFDSQFYDNIIEFMKSMYGGNLTLNPGDYPEDYPILIDVKEADMPAEHYKRAVNEAIELINQTLGFEVYRKTTSDDARYVFDYSRDNSSFVPEYIQVDDVWYIDTATIYILNAATNSSWFEILKGEATHELFTHGTGFRKHSDDPQDVSSTPVWDSDITQNEKNAVEINLKLQSDTNIDKYKPE